MADYVGKDFARFEIESSMELIADQFTATAPGADIFRNASPTDTVTLDIGLLDDLGVPTMERVMDGGTIDNYALSIDPTSITTTIRGRDRAAAVKDASFSKIYRRAASLLGGSHNVTGFMGAGTSQLPFTRPPLSPIDPLTGQPEIPEVFGRFFASDIVREICTFCGLSLSWGAPFDYELLSDFSAVGNAIDIIRTLIEPFRQVEPLQCDLRVVGSTLVIQQREMIPTSPPMILDANETSALTHIGIQRRPLTKYGKVTLTGSKTGGTGRDVFLLPDLVTVRDSMTHFNPDGSIASKTTTETTRYEPGNYVKKIVRETTTVVQAPSQNSGTYVMTETTENLWQDFRFDNNGVLNVPNMLESVILRKGVDPTDPDLVNTVQERSTITYQYDKDNYLKSMNSIKRLYDRETKTLRNNQMLVKTVSDIGALTQEQVTEVYGPDESGKGWLLNTVERQPASGHRIGGPGRFGGGGGSAGNTPPLTVTRTFSTDKDAVVITYHNDNLTVAHMDIIMSQFIAANGKTETEIDFDGVSLPWIKGKAIAIRNLLDEEGVAIALDPAMVIDSNVIFDESTDQPSAVISGKALSWA